MQRYTRTDAWSIESNGVKYSIQPWEFETISVDVLDLYISASNLIDAEDDSFFNNTCAISIRGKAEFPSLGFVGKDESVSPPLEIGEFMIFPIDPDAMENEFHMGAGHLRATLGEYNSEFDSCDANSMIGDPNVFGVCRLRNDFLRIYTNREVFKELALGLKRGSISRLTIKVKLYNLYTDGSYLYRNGKFSDDWGSPKKKLFAFQENPKGASDYVSYGIVESLYKEYRIYEMETHRSKINEKNRNIIFQNQISEKFNEFDFKLKNIKNFNIYILFLIFFVFCMQFFI